MIATASKKMERQPAWAGQLGQLRKWIRTYLLLKGLAILLVTAALWFWISLAIDWLWEPPVAVRLAILIGFFPLALFIVFRHALGHLAVPLPDSSMALLLERRYPLLKERLLTVVELGGSRYKEEDCDPLLVAQIGEEIAPLFPLAGMTRILNFRPLITVATAAALLVLSVAAFFLFQTAGAQIWAARNLAFRDLLWPRATRIAVAGFAPTALGHRVEKVARGGQVKVRVRADLDFELPQVVEVHFATEDGTARKARMTRLKGAVPGRDTEQEYEYIFTNVRASTPLSVVAHSNRFFAKADRVDGLKIDAVESPTLVDIGLQYNYPAYLGKRAATGSVRLNPPIPQGTHVRAICRANKPLARAFYRKTSRVGEAVDQEIVLDAKDGQQMAVDLGSIGEDTQVDFRLIDTDRVGNVELVRLVLRTLEDQLPDVDVQLEGVGKSITPLALIPLRGTVTDDYGVDEAWIAYATDGGVEQRHPLALVGEGKLSEEGPYHFDVESLQLQPGQSMTLQARASDHSNLRDPPIYGEGLRYTLKIVTESQLRAELERREKILRRRMETILAEARRMEDSLKRIGSDRAATDGNRKTTESPPDRTDSIRMVRVESALESADRMRHETANVGLEFARILIELRNNRVAFLGELEQRIGGRIVSPLERIAGEEFPQLEGHLQNIREQIVAGASLAAPLTAAQGSLQAILRQMESVLENMLKLQRFNEVLADLRKIIDAQQEVSRQTLEQREALEKELKEQLKKDLLE